MKFKIIFVMIIILLADFYQVIFRPTPTILMFLTITMYFPSTSIR